MTTTSPDRERAWRTVDILVAAVIAVAFGVVFVVWNGVWAASTPVFTALPAAQAIIYGVWLMPGVLVGLIVRKPGAALFAGLLSATVSALVASQWGLDTILSGTIQGGGAEIAFALGRYRTWTLPIAILGALLAGAGAVVHDIALYWAGMGPGFWAVFTITLLLSAALIAGVGSWLLLRALVATGVLSAFAVGREQREI
jgi:energy-coupling factor transport system substrate-specific component